MRHGPRKSAALLEPSALSCKGCATLFEPKAIPKAKAKEKQEDDAKDILHRRDQNDPSRRAHLEEIPKIEPPKPEEGKEVGKRQPGGKSPGLAYTPTHHAMPLKLHQHQQPAENPKHRQPDYGPHHRPVIVRKTTAIFAPIRHYT